MKSNFTIILFCALLIPFATIGQERKVSGTVTDLETGEVLPGVTIQIEGTSTGTITDSDGNYSLTVSEDDALVFSFIGYQTTKVGLQGRTVIDIGLNLDIAELGEVVVTGYSVERKRDQLGAVAVVKAKDLADLSNPNVINNIQGRVPGVFVDLAGDPGQGANVRIRGNSTLGNNAPLYIVDGVPVQPFTTNENGSSNIEWGLAWLNPNDIETIQVLKDASSASIYGSRASNGVVIITTKQPTKQEPQVTLSVRTSVDNWNQREQLTNNRQRAIVEFWGAVNDGADPNATGVYNYVWRLDPSLGPGVQGTGVPVLEEIIYPEWLDEADQMRPAGFGGNIEEGTDWWDEVAQTAVVQNYDVSFSHGGENGGIHFSFNHFNQEGVVINTGYKRTGARLNSNYNFFEKRLTVGQNLSISKGERRWMDAGFGGTPEQGAFRIKSIIPVRTEDGRFAGPPGAGFSDRDNPVALAHDNRDDRIHNLKVLGNLYADLEIVEGLNFRTSFGIDYDNIFTRDMFRTYSRGFLSNSVAELTQRQTHLINWVANNTLTYSKAFGNHSITAFVGTEAVKNEVTITAASGREFALETPEGFQLEAAQGERSSDGSSTGFSLFSYFGKVSYALNDKYLASVTVRRDGSSRFGRNDQFAVFPAVQLGWRIGDEPFLSGARWLSDLKLRYAWGQAGNQDIQNEARFSLYKAIYAPTSVILPWGGGCVEVVCPDAATSYDIGNNDTGVLPSGFVNIQTGNENLVWETQTENNLGVDWGLFDGQVVGSFEVFRKETEDILIQPTAIAAFGDGASRFVNGASVETTGWEAALAYQGQSGEFTYSISANLSGYRDKITDVPEDLWPSFPGNEEQNIIGQSPDVLFGYRTSGIFQNQAEVDAHADQVGARVGALRFVDLNEDGVINALDQEYGPINGLPDVQYGLNAQVSWKNLDFSMFLWGTIGREIAIDVTRAELSALINGENGMVNTLDAWSPTNTDSHIPAISNSLNPFGFSLDYNVRDGDYLALRQVVLGYTLPSQSLGFVSNARIYVQGENLFWGIKKEGADGYPFAPWRIEDVGNFQTSYPKPLRMTIGFTASF